MPLRHDEEMHVRAIVNQAIAPLRAEIEEIKAKLGKCHGPVREAVKAAADTKVDALAEETGDKGVEAEEEIVIGKPVSSAKKVTKPTPKPKK